MPQVIGQRSHEYVAMTPGVTLSAVAELLHVDPSTVTRTAERLHLDPIQAGGRAKLLRPTDVCALALYFHRAPLNEVADGLRECARALPSPGARAAFEMELESAVEAFDVTAGERAASSRQEFLRALHGHISGDVVARLEVAYATAGRVRTVSPGLLSDLEPEDEIT